MSNLIALSGGLYVIVGDIDQNPFQNDIKVKQHAIFLISYLECQ